ncbi:hypothetical protein AAZX31_04G151200 [Glycine max]
MSPRVFHSFLYSKNCRHDFSRNSSEELWQQTASRFCLSF